MKKLASLFVIAGMLFISCGNKTNQEEEVVAEDTVAVVMEDTVAVVTEDTVPVEEVAPVAQAAPKKAVKKQKVSTAKADVSNAKKFEGATTKDAASATFTKNEMSGGTKADASDAKKFEGATTKDAASATFTAKPMSGSSAPASAPATSTPKVSGGKKANF